MYRSMYVNVPFHAVIADFTMSMQECALSTRGFPFGLHWGRRFAVLGSHLVLDLPLVGMWRKMCGSI